MFHKMSDDYLETTDGYDWILITKCNGVARSQIRFIEKVVRRLLSCQSKQRNLDREIITYERTYVHG